LERAQSLALISPDECEEVGRIGRRARGAATQYARYLESANPPHVPRTRKEPRTPEPRAGEATREPEPRNPNRAPRNPNEPEP
jgi:hypothetical protein